MRRLSWITIASIAWMGGCTIIAGLDGDYLVGDVGTGGAGNNNPVGGSPPGSGGDNTGAATTTMSTGANGGTMQSGGSGGMGGSLGGGGDGGTIGPGGMGGGGPTFQVACPGDTCGKGEVCCVSPTSGNPSSGCFAPGGCQLSEIEIACDGPEDCDGGEVCCGTHIGYYTSVICVAAGTCTALDEFTMCWGDNPGNQNCPMSETCFASSSLPGYGYCD